MALTVEVHEGDVRTRFRRPRRFAAEPPRPTAAGRRAMRSTVLVFALAARLASVVRAEDGIVMEPAAIDPGLPAASATAAPPVAVAAAPPAVSAAAVFTLSTNVPESGWISPDFALEIRVDPGPTAAQGTIVIWLGETDATGLFAAIPGGLRYDPSTVPLPTGATTVTVALASPDGTRTQIGTFALQVLKDFAGSQWEIATFTPAIEVGVVSQVASDSFPDPSPAQLAATGSHVRDTFADWTLRTDLAGQLARDDFAAGTQWSLQGTSHAADALRASTDTANTLQAPTEIGDAPNVDLASYAIAVRKWDTTLTVGTIAYGASRHLVSSFASRGAMLQVPISTAADLTFMAGNAQSIVGWSNFSGLGETGNQVYSGTMGLNHTFDELATVRVEASLLEGESRPRPSFNQGAVTDAEESVGGSLRMVVTDATQRFRLDGAFTRSSFDNQHDPQLDTSVVVVPTARSIRNAYYVDAAYDVLHDFKVTDTRTLLVTLGYQNERIQPLFRSLAATTLADVDQHVFSLQSICGDMALSAWGTLAEDNLAHVRSLLTTKTRQAAASMSISTASWLSRSGEIEPWWPMLDYNGSWVHQFGTGIPPDGSFNESQVPDQVSIAHGPGLRWTTDTWALGYQYALSDQDNQQKGREKADLVNQLHMVFGSVTPVTSFSLGLDYTLERARSREQDRTDVLHRFGVNAFVRPFDETIVMASGSVSYGGDQRDLATSRNHDLSLEVSQGYPIYPQVKSRFFVRYAQVFGSSRDETFDLDQQSRAWSVNVGTSVALF